MALGAPQRAERYAARCRAGALQRHWTAVQCPAVRRYLAKLQVMVHAFMPGALQASICFLNPSAALWLADLGSLAFKAFSRLPKAQH